MDDAPSVVVRDAHDAGGWRGPDSRPWLRRIAHGVGFTRDWESRRFDEPIPPLNPGEFALTDHLRALPDDLIPTHAPPPEDDFVPSEAALPAPAAAPASESLRMWWLPSSRDG